MEKKYLLFYLFFLLVPLVGNASYEFQIPNGWIDLSKGQNSKDFTSDAAALVEMTKNMNIDFLAADPKTLKTNYPNWVGVKCYSLDGRSYDEEFLNKHFEEMLLTSKKAGSPIDYLTHEIINVDDEKVLRAVSSMKTKSGNLKTVHYIWSDGNYYFRAFFWTTADRFDNVLPVFDSAIKATIFNHKTMRTDWILIFVFVFIVFILIVFIFSARVFRTKN